MSKAVELLQKHLVKVKMACAQREHELLERIRLCDEQKAQLEADYEIAKEELQLCWAFVEQLKKENTLKWRCEERDDWKALVQSMQDDRARLLRENATLRRKLGEGHDDDEVKDETPAQPRSASSSSSRPKPVCPPGATRSVGGGVSRWFLRRLRPSST
eukprot:CAMPEP_0118911190 /NCGR_PEP_ID=MMETSP1166-20130328/12995_1 /TAXON_ID=1104430 /ORGANISM="Chrysoreinhardia sp, Strain CCMP3193" /LENGTH=158 /DNA_ID=CAMNT_0006850667 /DNA_START=82 /DNA_END=554 /DNA_ORIENTATION=+